MHQGRVGLAQQGATSTRPSDTTWVVLDVVRKVRLGSFAVRVEFSKATADGWTGKPSRLGYDGDTSIAKRSRLARCPEPSCLLIQYRKQCFRLFLHRSYLFSFLV